MFFLLKHMETTYLVFGKKSTVLTKQYNPSLAAGSIITFNKKIIQYTDLKTMKQISFVFFDSYSFHQ